MWGSPGTILAARACSLDVEWRESAELLYENWDRTTDRWPYHLYGKRNPYLGPAHGFAGNVHALRGFVPDGALRERATRVLARVAEQQDGLVNWPPLDGPFADQADKLRVQWCHGAPGLVSTLGELMPIELATAAGELTWRAGPLRKGPGLCHGTAGNGYAFLRLYSPTSDSRWLERARSFAMHAAEQVEAQRVLTGHGRYTLWTGDLGVALYLRACLDGAPDFPTIDYF
jgi:Lanthionine synthetase C-like protein